MAKQILFSEKARTALKNGIDKVANVVKATLGPQGRAIVLDKGFGAPTITRDGVSVAKEIELEDKIENMGAEIVKEVASKTNDKAGDGTTTATLLTQAMAKEALKNVSAGLDPIKLSKGLEEAASIALSALKKLSIPISGKEEISDVATISARDRKVGDLIAETMEEVGKDGVVTVEESQTLGITKEVVKGMQFDKGYVSPYMVTNSEKMEAVLEDPYVLVTDQKISAINDLLPILEKLIQAGKKKLVIIADDIEGEALATLVVNKLRGVFEALAVKAPGFGDRKKETLEDIAILTGAEFISQDLGRKLQNVDITSLGEARRVISTKDNTTIVSGKGNKEDIERRIAQIKNEIQNTDSDFDKEKLQERLGKLSGGVAVIKVGASTEVEQKEKQDRVEDAVSATKAALEEGIIPGGGVALVRISSEVKQYIDSLPKENLAEMAGAKIFLESLYAPLKQIVSNAGYNGDIVLSKVMEGKDDFGFNAANGKYENLIKAGIIDPTKVTRLALENASSAVSLLVITEAVVGEMPEKEGEGKTSANMPPMNGGMPGMGGY